MMEENKSSEDTQADQKKPSENKKPLDLDDVLIDELGEFGRFQIRNIFLISLPIMICGVTAEYIFSAAATPHRCRIPECGENGKLHEYNPDWIMNAIPGISSGFASCERYAFRDLAYNGTLDSCPGNLFDHSKTIACEDFAYEKDNTVVYEFDLGCKDWLRAMAGTMYSLGTLFGLPITGWMSDRYGRKIALVISICSLGVFGLIRAFSVNYTMYLILQFLQNIIGSGAFSAAYIFAAELVGPKYRVVISATTTALFAVGQVMLGTIAWLISPWRYMIMTLHVPCFFVISHYWLLTESVRWLLAKNKYSEAKNILYIVAKVNKTHISEKSLDELMTPPKRSTSSSVKDLSLIRRIIRSPVLLRRVCTTPIWWITTVFIYYGLSINSTGLSETMHLNYILTCAIEIPGFYTSVLLLNRIGRKITLSSGFFFSAACNIAFVFIPSDMTALRLTVYLLGKFGISTVATALYLFTSELYPTEFRHTLLAFSSMIGRIGLIIAPLTPVLMTYWHGIPSLMFGFLSIISGILALTQPETLGTKIPDTVAEAEALGKPETAVDPTIY